MKSVFYIRYILKDATGYYYENWSNAKEAEIIAETKSEACEALKSILGKPDGGWAWSFVVDKISQLPISVSDRVVGQATNLVGVVKHRTNPMSDNPDAYVDWLFGGDEINLPNETELYIKA